MSLRKKIAWGAIVGTFMDAICLAAFWLGGFDFNERGEVAVMCLFSTVILFALGMAAVLTCPFINDEEDRP